MILERISKQTKYDWIGILFVYFSFIIPEWMFLKFMAPMMNSHDESFVDIIMMKGFIGLILICLMFIAFILINGFIPITDWIDKKNKNL